MGAYTVTSKYDELGKKFYYCHMRGFPYIPVMGSIGSKQKAQRICDLYNNKPPKQKGGADGRE